jgi:hypothetical protein
VKPVLLPLPNQIPATEWSHFCGVRRVSRNIATLSDPVSARFATLRQCHFAIYDDVRRFNRMCVVGIKGVRAVLPHVGVKKSLCVQLAFQQFWVGDHFPFTRNEFLCLLFLRSEYVGRNSRDHPARD